VRWGRVLVALWALGWSAALAAPASAAPLDGSVSGTITNGTAGGSVPVGETVSLIAYGRKEQTMVGQRSAPVDGDGAYHITGLDRDPNVVYVAFMRHGGVTYTAAQPFQLQDEPDGRADIQVFEPTTSDDAIRFDRLNLIVVGVQPGMLQLMQMGAVANGGDRAFVTSNPQDQAAARGLQFGLPKGALGAQFQAGFRSEDVAGAVGGLQVTSPVTPGPHEFALAFQVPYTGDGADLSLQLPYAVGAFTLYVPSDGPRLETGQLTPQAPAQLGGQTYGVYTGQNLGRGTALSAQLRNLPAVGGLSTNQVALIGLGVAFVVLGAGLWLFSVRARSVGVSGRTRVDLEEERLQLVVRLAALDERYAAGDIARNQYAVERERGKQRLVELTAAARGTRTGTGAGAGEPAATG